MPTDDQRETPRTERSRPVYVDALATRVISVLSSRQAISPGGMRQFVLDHLLRAALCPGGFEPAALIAELRGHRLSVDEIIDIYIPQAAIVLGQMWVDDDASFAQVTIGSMRLQSLVGEAAAGSVPDVVTDRTRLTGLVVVPANEQHFLGASVLSAQLRRLGCDVGTSFDEDEGSLAARVMLESPDLALVTCSRTENLDTVRRTVQTIRSAAPESCVIALGGLVTVCDKDLKADTGVDIVTSKAAEAVSFCASEFAASRS